MISICIKYAIFYFETESRRSSLLQIRASSEETSVDAGELFTDLKEKVRSRADITFLGKNGYDFYSF